MKDIFVRGFLDVLLGHVEATGGVSYHRICQVSNPRSKLPTASAGYHAHLLALLSHRAGGDYRCSLKAAKIRYPFKFVLIDRRFLLLQLRRYDAADTARYGANSLFWEAQPALVRAFYGLWCDLDSETKTRALTEAEVLGPLGPPAQRTSG